MKKPEKYFEDFCQPSNDDLLRVKYDVLLLIKQAQIDAIKETCKRCSESASFEYANYRCEIPDLVSYVGDDEYGYRYIDKNSILSVADELIREL